MSGDRSIEDWLSVVSVTHYAPRDNYGDLAPPSAGIVRETIRSFRERMNGLEHCDHYLVYNRPEDIQEDSGAARYRDNLAVLADELDTLTLRIRPNRGLGAGLLEGLDCVETPLVLFVEHDWELIEPVDVDGLLATFAEHEEVNSVRFNKRPNRELNWDTVVVEDADKPVPLCRVSTVGNHPQVARTDVFRSWVEQSEPSLPLVLRGFWYHYSTPHNVVDFANALFDRYVARADVARKFDDVEFVLDTEYKRQIREEGFETAHADWGAFLYGPYGGGPYVRHLGR